MKIYRVRFTGFSAFTDSVIVYATSRQEAIRTVKDHYGKRIKIVSARQLKEE